MQARISNPAMTVPGAFEALQAVSTAAEQSDLPHKTIELVNLRASQINGCGVCLDMHTRGAKKAGETDERLFTVAAWRDSPYFNDAERIDHSHCHDQCLEPPERHHQAGGR